MTSMVKVARLHLVDRFGDTWLVWGVLALAFVINLAIYAVIPLIQPEGNFTGALASSYLFMIIIGVQAANQVPAVRTDVGGQPPDVLPRHGSADRRAVRAERRDPDRAVGAGGRHRRLGPATALLPGAVDPGRALVPGAGHQRRATGVGVPDRPVDRADLPPIRPDRHPGVLRMWTVLRVGAVLLVTWRQWWPAVGSFLSDLDVLAASGMLALAAAAVAGGGYLTIRRITV